MRPNSWDFKAKSLQDLFSLGQAVCERPGTANFGKSATDSCTLENLALCVVLPTYSTVNLTLIKAMQPYFVLQSQV